MMPHENNSRVLADLEYLENHIAVAGPDELYENASHIYNLVAKNIGKIIGTEEEHLKNRYMTIVNQIMKYLPPSPEEQDIKPQTKISTNPLFVELQEQYRRLATTTPKPVSTSPDTSPISPKPAETPQSTDIEKRLYTIEKALSQVLTYFTQQETAQKKFQQNISNEVNNIKNTINTRISAVEAKCKRVIPQPILESIIYSILTHCNLNCKGCSHFAPIVDKHIVSPEIISRDLTRLSNITGNILPELNIIGGEPLLHPYLLDILTEARNIFANAKIKIVSNGILLGRQEEAFWLTCAEKNIEIAVTRYPINLDFDKLEQTAKAYNITYSNFAGDKDAVRTMRKDTMDLQGTQDGRNNFFNCRLANDCFILREGNIYPCAKVANSRYFNSKFHTNMQMTKSDYIDIYSIDSYDTLANFLSRPVPFCRYCDIAHITEGNTWELSNRELTEWT